MNKGFAIACSTLLLAAGLTGCSLNPFTKSKAVDYRSAGKGAQLDVPPDLTTPRYDDRYRVVGSGGNVVGGATPVLPKIDNVRLERQGNERWLVVNQPPEVVWPQARSFWLETGFSLVVDRADVGVLETEWLESRTRIEGNMVRSMIGKVIDAISDSGRRDKYRMRLERGANNTTEIYLSHRGMEEMPVGRMQQGTPTGGFAWMPRPADPGVEAEMLNRLLIHLGVPAAQAKQVATTATGNLPNAQSNAAVRSAGLGATVDNSPARASLQGGGLGVFDPFDRAWRRVGLALDRVGFTVVDRDRTQGTYYVRYAEGMAKEEGLLDKLKFWKSDDVAKAEQYRVSLKESAGQTVVSVLDKNGALTPQSVSDPILSSCMSS